MVRMAVVPVDKRPRRQDVEERVLSRDPQRSVERGAVRQQDGVVVFSECIERDCRCERGRVRVRYADRSVRIRGHSSGDLDIAKEPEPRISCGLFKLVFAVLWAYKISRCPFI